MIPASKKVKAFVSALFLCILLLLTACSEEKNESKSKSATLVFSSSLNLVPSNANIPNVDKQNVNRQKATARENTSTALTSISITVTDIDGLFSETETLTAGVSTLSFAVPSRTALVISGEAFSNDTLVYQGGTEVLPIELGSTRAVSFTMYSVEGEPILVDVGLANKPANGDSVGASLSLSQNYVLFTSVASNLVENDTNNTIDLFLRDLNSNKITNINSSSEGVIANNAEADLLQETAISADGRYVVFASISSNLVSDDTNGVSDIFLKDTLTKKLTRISLSEGGGQADKASYQPDISNDGQKILFYSDADLIDNGGGKLFLYDRISQTVNALVGNAKNPRLSGDGKVFVYTDSLTGGLKIFDINTKMVTEIIPSESQGDQAASDPSVSSEYEVSLTGQYVVFVTNRTLSGVLANQVYVYDRVRNTSQLASSQKEVPLVSKNTDLRHPSISDDGRFLIFRFNKQVYITDVATRTLQVVAEGENPFLSLDGQRLGYTNVLGRVLIQTNPLYSVLSNSPSVERPAPENLIMNEDEETGELTLNWSPVSNNKYYRVYLSSEEGVSPDNYFTAIDGLQIETSEEQIFIPTQYVNPGSVYAVVTAINDGGESLPSAELVIKTVAVDISVTGNGITIPSQSQIVRSGEQLSFELLADAGYRIKDANGCGGSLEQNNYVTSPLEETCTVTVNYEINTSTLSYTAGVGGSLSGIATQTVDYNANGSAVVASPDEGYRFVGWSDGITSSNRVDYNVVDNISATASFVLNSAPVITTPSNLSFPENELPVTTVVATDANLDPVTYRINGGDDQKVFSINTETGLLSFNFVTDYESPSDVNLDNIYIVSVVASDGSFDSEAVLFNVTIRDVQETGPPLNDTGFATCWNGESFATCPQSSYPRQDAEFGLDNTNFNDKDGLAGFRYTKVSSGGSDLEPSSLNWACIRDEVTGLLWEAKSTGNDSSNNKKTATWSSVSIFVANEINSERLCGYTDWRMPTITELVSLVNYSRNNPSIDTTYFKNTYVDTTTFVGNYWSATESIDGQSAMAVQFITGAASFYEKNTSRYYRLVRGKWLEGR